MSVLHHRLLESGLNQRQTVKIIWSLSALISVIALVIDDKITIGNTMKLTLACDHRTIDGVTGSLFLQTLKGYLENPVTILV